MKKLLLITILLLIALLLAVPASAGSDTTQVRGVVPFAISGVSAVDITSTGATITWLTNAPATSKVYYGTRSGSYGTPVQDGALTGSHSISLSGLTADTTYYYKVESTATIDGSPQTVSSAEYSFKTAASSGGGSSGGSSGGGGGGGGASDRIFLAEYMSPPGTFNRDVSLRAYDGICTLMIPQGTVGKTKEGWALSYIILKPLQPEDEKPPAPVVGGLVGGIYRLEPDGVTFSPPVTIYMLYKENQIPAGMGEENLKIGYWDSQQKVWTALEGCKVDAEKNAVTAPLSHFSYYAVLAVPPAPAAFTISALTVSPAEVLAGQPVTINALVTNSGETAGDYEAVLEIEGKAVDRQKVSVPARSAKTVSFTTSLETAGSYTVRVNGLSGTLKVTAPQGAVLPRFSNLTISSSPALIGQEVTISVEVSNPGSAPLSYRVALKVDGKVMQTQEVALPAGESRQVNFLLKPEFAGTLKVEVEGLSGTLEVKMPPSAASFSLSRLRLSTERVLAGDKVVVGAVVTNSGDLPGVYNLEFRVKGRVVETKTIPVEGHASREVSFTFTPEREGAYAVAINEQSVTVNVAGRFFGPWMVFGIVLAVCVAVMTTMLVLRKSRQMYGYYSR